MMKSVEVNLDLNLNEAMFAQVELHSFHNIMTVVFGELQFLEKILGDDKALGKSKAICEEFLVAITDLNKATAIVERWDEHQGVIFEEINAAGSSHTIKKEYEELFNGSIANLKDILAVVEVRVKEFTDRIDYQEKWKRYPIDAVVSRLKQVLTAMARNSRGRYGIVFNSDDKGDNDYLVVIDVAGQEDGAINLPPVLLDTLRDLTANARKYSDPGGLIECSLKEDDEAVTLSVSDNGRGIPENEMEAVVQFGVRGSNTKPSETKGGGYGLTKAAYVCQKYGGRMWMASELGVGTRVTLNIPKFP
jgi:signal transduction histidine kinase